MKERPITFTEAMIHAIDDRDNDAAPEVLPFDAEADLEREAEIAEPITVKIVGGAAVHLSDDGDDTYCGLGSDRSYTQVEAAVTCKSCRTVAIARAGRAVQ